jgi:ABC-type branched-subunit amino acid transport system substrate-binding protein
MKKISVLIMRPEGEHSSSDDQALGARLSAGSDIAVEEQLFDRDRPGDLENKLADRRGKIAGVVGAMRASESQRLGKVAGEIGALCFVANNNPAVWQKRRHVFHIGFPSSQTAAAVAAELAQKTNRRRYLLLHDRTEFQSRAAAIMEASLTGYGMDVKALAYAPGDPLDFGGAWKPEVIYVVFSSERKAAEIIGTMSERAPDIPLVIGRSLLRESFLRLLRGRAGEFWFVDTIFRRNRVQTESQQQFMRIMEENSIAVPTTNHAFGWDCMKFCAAALKAGDGDRQRAIAYLESGVTLEGASGTCSFNPDNHNGRTGLGPTILSRWNNDRFEDV